MKATAASVSTAARAYSRTKTVGASNPPLVLYPFGAGMVASVQLLSGPGNQQPLGSLQAVRAFPQPISQLGFSQNSPVRPSPSWASAKTPQCVVRRDRQDIHYESSILIQSKDMLSCPLKDNVRTLCISLKCIQRNCKMAQRQPSNTQSTFSIDAADKQHHHITKLHKHPREQTCNKLCTD